MTISGKGGIKGMDRLETMFAAQKQFNEFVRTTRHLEFDEATWLQKDALALFVEMGEVLEEARYKWWKNYQPMAMGKLHEEIVDVFHFFLSLCLDAGLDAESLYQGYQLKHQENIKRQQGLSERSGYHVPDSQE